ncbi:hypothetical protein ABL78_4644 [Leptomonas seymouri]|uniref:Uncharacterized protein n=1 Tax=Leptomonas seymouri TaxID=5684 RepID=A0A0N0P5R6_LEPSE|nr:hypothetical protein ABL78_4644 [Leptomonas seymouri]|eukprot:KPI86297.1 hypothetical protein ABL78_4644 [Leptomonas seymouri]
MTFVFEACELPFGTVTADYASCIDGLLQANDLTHLPLWDRCMLAVVLPVVLQRRKAAADAVAASSSTQPRQQTVSTNSGSQQMNPSKQAQDGGDLADAAEDHPIVSPNAPPASTVAATVSDVEVALTIVRQLDELEVVYDSIVSRRKAQQTAAHELTASASPAMGTCATDAAADAGARQPKTSEEVMMEDLLQERFSETAPYLVDSDDESVERAREEGDVVDIAMCFTTRGESLGIGSSAVFGGHGYHPPSH